MTVLAAHRLLKFLMVASYLCIMLPSEEWGGPLLFWLLLGAANAGSVVAIACFLILLTAGLLLISMVSNDPRRDLVWVPLCLIVLAVPIVQVCSKDFQDPFLVMRDFIITLLVFVGLVVAVLYSAYRAPRKSSPVQ